MEHLSSDQPRAALGILGVVAEGPFGPLLRAQADSFAGVALLDLDRPEKALSCYLKAYELSKSDQQESRALEHLFNVLSIALALRDEERVHWASERIRDLALPSETFIAEAVRRIRGGGTPREYVLGEDARRFAVRIAE